MRRWLISSLTLVLGLVDAGLAQESSREQIRNTKDYVVYYGKGKLEALSTYDLAIVQPLKLSAEDVAYLRERGTLVVAYLSLGEVEPSRPWYLDGRVDPRWLLRKNKDWGSYAVDVRQAGWRQLMVELTGEFLAKGFDGVFMDTVDVVDIYPETTASMVELVRTLRETYPNALLVQNRGFTVLGEVADVLDALMFESLTSSYDFDSETYIYTDNSFIAEQMVELKKRSGLVILALDYADTPAMAYRAVAAAKAYGFVPAVSTILLDEIPDYGLDEGGPDDVRVSDISVQRAGTRTAIVVKLENIGLSTSKRVSVSLTVDGEQIATQTYESLGIGEQKTWRVPWESASETASIRATAFSLSDKKAGNNLSLQYSAETVTEEPILPPEQQKRRPAANGPDLIATALTEALTIDGDLLDWGDMPCTEVNTGEQVVLGPPADWGGVDDLSSRVCYAWDANNLYLGFEVTDDAIVQKHTGSSLWRGDHVELWFDTQLQLDFASAEAGSDDFQIGLSPGDCTGAVEPDIFIWTPSRLREAYDGLIDYAVNCTGSGYRAEMRLPASVLTGLKLVSGHAIGVSFDSSDTDTPGSSEQEMMLSTAPNTQWGVPTLWNNLLLEGDLP